MTRVVDYGTVSTTLAGHGLTNLYYNSGSFGFPPGVATHTIGWVGPPDPTIRAEAVHFTRQIAEPFGETMVRLASRAWHELLPGTVWAMPRSHWAYELDFGSAAWMPAALGQIGIDSTTLAPLTTGAAIEFAAEEGDAFGTFLGALLANLSGSSDFQLAWPGRPVVCTVHHHKQLWWTTPDAALHAKLERMPGD